MCPLPLEPPPPHPHPTPLCHHRAPCWAPCVLHQPSTSYLLWIHSEVFMVKICFLIVALYKWKKVKVAQLCPTRCDPMDYTVPGILQIRILEWVAFAFSKGSSQPRDWNQVSYFAGGFFTSWATREALCFIQWMTNTQKSKYIGRRCRKQYWQKCWFFFFFFKLVMDIWGFSILIFLLLYIFENFHNWVKNKCICYSIWKKNINEHTHKKLHLPLNLNM